MEDASLSTVAGVGNCFIVGLSGATLAAEDKEILRTLRPAGVLLLGRNIDQRLSDWPHQLAHLLSEARKYAEREQFIVSVDHEGGRVHRFPPPITRFPAALSYTHRADEVAAAMATELRACGVNFFLGPVADVHSEPLNPVIGPRAFGTTPAAAADGALRFFKGLQHAGMIGVAKHFPGHGATTVDSHLALPTVQKTLDELKECELIPFQALIEAGVPAVMTAHVVIPDLDPHHPATMSAHVLGYLRDKLGFSGTVVSDDLDMFAVAKRFEERDGIATAFSAGCDLCIVARNPDPYSMKPLLIARNLHEAVRRGLVHETRIESARRSAHKLINACGLPPPPRLLTESELAPHRQLLQELL